MMRNPNFGKKSESADFLDCEFNESGEVDSYSPISQGNQPQSIQESFTISRQKRSLSYYNQSLFDPNDSFEDPFTGRGIRNFNDSRSCSSLKENIPELEEEMSINQPRVNITFMNDQDEREKYEDPCELSDGSEEHTGIQAVAITKYKSKKDISKRAKSCEHRGVIKSRGEHYRNLYCGIRTATGGMRNENSLKEGSVSYCLPSSRQKRQQPKQAMLQGGLINQLPKSKTSHKPMSQMNKKTQSESKLKGGLFAGEEEIFTQRESRIGKPNGLKCKNPRQDPKYCMHSIPTYTVHKKPHRGKAVNPPLGLSGERRSINPDAKRMQVLEEAKRSSREGLPPRAAPSRLVNIPRGTKKPQTMADRVVQQVVQRSETQTEGNWKISLPASIRPVSQRGEREDASKSAVKTQGIISDEYFLAVTSLTTEGKQGVNDEGKDSRKVFGPNISTIETALKNCKKKDWGNVGVKGNKLNVSASARAITKNLGKIPPKYPKPSKTPSPQSPGKSLFQIARANGNRAQTPKFSSSAEPLRKQNSASKVLHNMPMESKPTHNKTREIILSPNPNIIMSPSRYNPGIPNKPSDGRTKNRAGRKFRDLTMARTEGFLHKRSSGVIGSLWKLKYCILDNRKFKYYNEKHSINVRGVVDFDLYCCSVQMDHNKVNSSQFKIKFHSSNKILYFKCESVTECTKWVSMLQNNLATGNGVKLYNNPIHAVLNDTRFYKYNRISNSAMKNMADTGDVLLFTGSTFVCKLQRVLTRSRFDHVAIILKYSDGRLVILEATGALGVALFSWEDFVKNGWNQYYSKLVFRHLNYRRDLGTIVHLENFVKQVLGKKYKINATKLLRRHSSKISDKEELANEKSFFCSELVASVYKEMGILDENVSATQYWPVSFSADKNLELQKNAKFGEEMLVDFTL